MILLIDNYDSFTFNLYQYVGEIQPDIKVVRNDALSVEEALNLRPSHIIISPGPGYPAQAGICIPLVQEVAARQVNIPVLGICLGHQAICEAFGARIGHAKQLMHGKQSMVRLDTENPLFEGLPQDCPVARYHSLAALPETLPDCLSAIATTQDGEIMAVAHKQLPIFGMQFHPESIMTAYGMDMLRNYLR
ncbi:MAG: aminodeoxychorismate/anthranilate synthase component II [Coriobacteriia bacterium]|nr:aminodeoxychorismate/anthranilate synthase component II [Coriobacteriia bacterium]